MADTTQIRSIARDVAEEVMQAHLDSCPAASAMQATLDDLGRTVTAGFNRISEELKEQNKDLNRAMNLSGRHSERLKALERKKRNDDGSSANEPGAGHASSATIDPEEKPLVSVSQKVWNNFILALVIAVATAGGNLVWAYFIPAAPASTAKPSIPEPVHQEPTPGHPTSLTGQSPGGVVVRTP